jgi:tetratricopeptide (TPR) repeat protein
MKKLFTVIVIVVIAFSNLSAQTNTSSPTTTNQNSSSDEAKEERNKQIALASFKAYQSGDLEGAFKDVDKDVLIYRAGNAVPRKGLDSVIIIEKVQYPVYKAAFPDAKMDLLTAAADGDYVMLAIERSGTWKGNLSFWKPSGKSFKVTDVAIFKFNNEGKIIEQRFILPFSEVRRQVDDGIENDMNNSGYKLLGEKKYNEAIEVFKLNVKLYPKSANTYDSLGEAYAAAGNKKLAIENYEKSVKLDPTNENGKTILAKLKAK